MDKRGMSSYVFGCLTAVFTLLGTLAIPTDKLLGQDIVPVTVPIPVQDCGENKCDNGSGGCTQSCESMACDTNNNKKACHSNQNTSNPCGCNTN